jgi:hypothetical protein
VEWRPRIVFDYKIDQIYFDLNDIEHMNKYKAIFASAIALLSLVYTAGACAESIGLVEEKETGVIDWANGTAQAKGISAPIKKDAGKSPTNSPKALSEAKNDARRKLLETVKRIQITSKLSVGDMADRNKTIMTQIKEMVYDAGEIEKSRKYMSDGSIEASLQMNLHGGFAQLILPKEIRQIDTIKQLKPGKKSSAAKASSSSERASDIYTGLLVDARSIEAIPALVPKLFDENLAEVFGPAFVSREFAVQQGIAAYYTDMQAAKADPRVSDNPLIVKALRTDFPSRCNLVISNADASKLKSASDHLVFLKESRVVIVLSPP